MGSSRAPNSVRTSLRRFAALSLALALFLLLSFATRGMGVVGEVAAAWTWGPPPRVAVDLEGGQPTWSDPGWQAHAGSSWGPLRAGQARPIERIGADACWMPVAVNVYTGGLADWPARVVHGLTRSAWVVRALHLLLGVCLLVAVHRFARRFGGPGALGLAAVLLAADWTFVFYRGVLGGTELLLLGAGLGLLWGLWRHRWQASRSDGLLIALSLGLGLHAKITFAATAAAFAIAYLATRWDRPACPSTREKGRLRPARMVAIVGAALAPTILAIVHRASLPAAPRLWSHDGVDMQWSRLAHGLRGLISGGAEPAREMPQSLAYFLLEPLQWFQGALGAEAVGWWGAGPRVVGLAVVAAGVLLAWWGRPWRCAQREPADALLRFLALAVPLQIALLWLANRDLHHLAQAAPLLALLAGLACERVARQLAPSRTAVRAAWACALAVPFVLAGVASCWRTAPTLRTIHAVAVTAAGQGELLAMLREHRVHRLWTSDYDLYGVFEVLAPELELAHAWGAASVARDRTALLEDLLRAAAGGHYLVVEPSATRIYDLSPSPGQVERAAGVAGVTAMPVASLESDGGVRATLYAVDLR